MVSASPDSLLAIRLKRATYVDACVDHMNFCLGLSVTALDAADRLKGLLIA